MAVRFDAVGDELNRTANLPPNTSFTYILHSVVDANTASTIEPYVVALSPSFSDGWVCGIDRVLETFKLDVYSGGFVVRASSAVSRPTLGVPHTVFVRCAGTGTGLLTAGYREVGQTAWTTAANTLGVIDGSSNLYLGGLLGAYWLDGRKWNIKAWDRALSDAEIEVEARFERVKYPQNINFYLPLKSASDTGDKSGNGRNPTVVGSLTTQDGPINLWRPSQTVFVPQATASSTDLTVANAAHGQTSDNLTLGTTTATSLTVANAAHGQAADSIALSTTEAESLAVASATHAHTAGNLTLGTTTATSLAVNSAAHAHTADGVVIDLASTTLAVANAAHAHTTSGIAPTVRSGFPVVVSNTGAAAPYTLLTDIFSANAGDELSAIAIGGGLPVVVSRNAANNAAGTLKWLRRFVTRVDFTISGTNAIGAQQVAIYTAVVPSGGITERASFTTSTIANDGAQAVSPNNLPARLAVFAVDGTNGVGAIAWKGSMRESDNANDITTGSAATQVIKPFGADSLIIGGGWFVDGSTPVAASGCTEVVAPGAQRMPIWTRSGGAAGADVAMGSSITNSTLWALGLIEYLPPSTAKATKKLFCFGDSGIESTSSARQTAVVVQDTLAPNWEVFNYGVWWAKTVDTASRLTADLPSFPAIDAAIIQVGMNDISDVGGATWPTAARANILSIYSDLSGIPLAQFTGIGPLATPALAPAGYYEFRDWVTANKPSGTHLYSLDLVADPGLGYVEVLPAYLSPDGWHINAAGNELYGADIAAWLETVALENRRRRR